jgi:uncharacterized protein (TIGR03067 family)
VALDIERLQGAWHLAGAEVDGRTVEGADASIVISGNRFKAVGMGAPYEGTLTIDEKQRPARIDMSFDVGHAAGKTHFGIYRLAGDRLILCLNVASATHPTRFTSGPGLALETFERSRGTGPRRSPSKAAARVSASARKSPASAASKKNAVAADASPIEGEWQMVAGVFNGAPMSEEMVKWCKRVTRGDVTTVLAGPRTMMKARFTLDTSAKPVAIDYVILEGSGKGKSVLGIVEWRAESCSINMGDPGQPRPKDFLCKKGDKRTFTSWRLIRR